MSAMGDLQRDGSGEVRELVAVESGRVDAVIAAAYPDLSRARVQRLIDAGHVHVDGLPVRKSGQVETGAHIQVAIPATPHVVATSNLRLPIIYEDDDLLVIDKPPGVAVHGAPGDTGPSVANWFLARYPELAPAFDAERPGIVHRLDKDTSGVLLLAKTPEAQWKVSRAFEARETEKTYLAVTDGIPRNQRAVIEAAIARHPGDRTRMTIAKQGRESRTSFQVLAIARDNAFLEVRPETGRTHQIRVHLKAIGAAVRYDRVYGKEGEGRQMLHAWRIKVPHPAGGTLTVTAPLPADMRAEVRTMSADKVALPYTIATPPVRES
ncbi:MAG: RluA family pseudouridine synthase [Dehalococcoidia bacterium]